MTLALVGTGAARMRALGSQPCGGSTIRWGLSDITAVNSSLIPIFFLFLLIILL